MDHFIIQQVTFDCGIWFTKIVVVKNGIGDHNYAY